MSERKFTIVLVAQEPGERSYMVELPTSKESIQEGISNGESVVPRELLRGLVETLSIFEGKNSLPISFKTE